MPQLVRVSCTLTGYVGATCAKGAQLLVFSLMTMAKCDVIATSSLTSTMKPPYVKDRANKSRFDPSIRFKIEVETSTSKVQLSTD